MPTVEVQNTHMFYTSSWTGLPYLPPEWDNSSQDSPKTSVTSDATDANVTNTRSVTLLSL
jgi:hypothetical protein